MVRTILLRGGTTAEHDGFTGYDRELTVDTDKETLVIHTSNGSVPLARLSDVPTKLSELTDGVGLWTKAQLTKLSQLEDDIGYWTNLKNVSQLENDLNWKTTHCEHCEHCTYCSQCSRCNNVHCNQVHCNQVRCSDCSKCLTINCDCDCNCDDDNCFISGSIKTTRGFVDVHELRVGDFVVDAFGGVSEIVGLSHGGLKNRRAIRMRGREGYLITEEHPLLLKREGELRYCAAANSSFDPDREIVADNGTRGRYADHDYEAWFLSMEKLPADTPTVCPITKEECVVKFGSGYVLIPGQVEEK